MKATILYSSLTGNTKRVAEAVQAELEVNAFSVTPVHLEANKPVDMEAWPKEALYAVGYWVDKGTANQGIINCADAFEGKDVFLFGTLGASPDSEHAKKCIERVEALFEKSRVHGHFLCRGKIDPKLTARLRQLPDDHSHRMTPEREARHREAAKHPNEADFEAARVAVKSAVKDLKEKRIL